MTLEEFSISSLRAAWLDEGSLRVYVRRGHRRGADGKIGLWLDVANVEAPEAERGKGAFREFLGRAELLSNKMGLGGVWVENVINPRLRGFLERAGYCKAGVDCPFAPSYAKSREAIVAATPSSPSPSPSRGSRFSFR